ncbi:MAG: asparagine synthase (glutamine-hydrolyzing) [bacterium]|nr:asparagine synthase (glutamine-hydrolyzing) [bacterium]
MCGINGFAGKDESLIAEMNRRTAHRGPDFAGVFTDKYVSLGHNLLSIRDASDISHQPYRKDASPWILLFNGQIYNTSALRSELGEGTKGVELDTELLYQAIEKYGWDFINHIHGMYAIALYNQAERIIRLYRDPSGQKLLYYYFKDGTFIWSSEIKGILIHKEVAREVDTGAILTAVNIGYIPGERTLFRYIRKLNLSQFVTFDINSKTLSSDYFLSEADHYYPDNVSLAFTKLIEEHLQSKQKIAVNLSGGMDSSLLVHEMSRLGHEIHSYTNYFEEAGDKYNTDALLARRLSKDYGTDHHEIVVTKKAFLENFIDSYSYIEEPNYNITLPAYLQTAKVEGALGDRNRVVLSGDGGDEIFGGYPYYMRSIEMNRQRQLLTPFFFNIIKNWRNNSSFDFGDMLDRWIFFKRFYTRFAQKSDSSFRSILRESSEKFISLYQLKDGPVYPLMLLDRLLWMGGENFIRSDKLYMSQSLELRSPLSYHPFRLYIDNKLGEQDYIGKSSNKAFLRKHYKGKLPDYIVERQDKSGWRSPIASWYNKDFKNLFMDILPTQSGPLIDWTSIRAKVEETHEWPGKYIHLYLSLAILKKEFNLDI